LECMLRRPSTRDARMPATLTTYPNPSFQGMPPGMPATRGRCRQHDSFRPAVWLKCVANKASVHARVHRRLRRHMVGCPELVLPQATRFSAQGRSRWRSGRLHLGRCRRRHTQGNGIAGSDPGSITPCQGFVKPRASACHLKLKSEPFQAEK